MLSLLHLPPSLFPPRHLSLPSSPKKPVVRSSMEPQPSAAAAAGASSVMAFPYLPPPHRDLMVELLATIESQLGPSLLPSAVPSDVLSFQNQLGTSCGALDIRSGAPGSSVDFILESWLHCKVPTGALNITTIFGFLNSSTDAPHLLMEFIQSSPTSLILFVDLLPRKDLVLHPDYLNEFYQDTNLDKPRRELEKVRQVLPYRSSSLYIRSVLSPTAIAVNIDCGAGGGQSAMEEIMSVQIGSAANEIVQIWLDRCTSSSKDLGDRERCELVTRDRERCELVTRDRERCELVTRDNLIKRKTIEIDLAANLPRLFGPDVADRVVQEIQKAFRVS